MIRHHIIRTILFAILGLVIGLIVLALSPKIYEGRAQLVVGNQNQTAGRFYPSNIQEDVATILQTGLAINPQTEVLILKGEGVFEAGLRKVATEKNDPGLLAKKDELYNMYDVVSAPDSGAALVRARAYSPDDAAALSSAIADSYNEIRQAKQQEAVQSAVKYLEEQSAVAKKDLEAAEEAFKKEKETLGMPEIAANVTRDIEYQAQLRALIDNSKAELAADETSISVTQSQLDAQPKYMPGDQSQQKNATLQGLENQLADLNRQKQTLLVDYFEDAPQIKLINGSIASVKNQIATLKKQGFEKTVENKTPDQLRRTLEARLADYKIAQRAVQERINKLEANQTAHNSRVTQIPAAAMKLADLGREVDIKDTNYKRLMIQQEDLKNRSAAIARAAQIIYTTQPDPNPVLPRPSLILVISVLGGAILGLLVSFAIEAMRLRIYSSTQLQELTGLPVAGVVHDLPGPSARKLLTSIREPNPIVSESYRFMAFSAMSRKDTNQRKILLTAVDNKAGCSTTAAQFATALAQAGSRVLLVDCALEDPTLTKVFGIDQKSGVSDILSQTQLPTADSQVGSETSTPNLRVVGAGTEGRNAIKVATTQQINGMVGALAASTDVLVIDTVSCLSSSDAARLVPYVDEVYLVVSAKSANMRNVAAAIDVLTLASAASVKFVVTKGSRGEEAVMRQANLASVRA
jgi:succinoglycan biosynthesis transport protein ExoP